MMDTHRLSHGRRLRRERSGCRENWLVKPCFLVNGWEWTGKARSQARIQNAFCVLCAACGVLDLCVYYVPQARAEAAVKLLRRNDVGLEIFTFLVCGGQVNRGEQTATMYI